MGTIFVDNIKQQSSQGSGTITIGASGETVSFASGVKQSNILYPAFEAYSDSSQSLTDNTYAKVALQTEAFDTNSNFDNSSNYRFTPTVAGKYYIEGQVFGRGSSASTCRTVYVSIYKNGSAYKESRIDFDANDAQRSTLNVSAVIDMNGSSDYVELYAAVNISSGSASLQENTKSNYFLGYRLGT